ncbi:PspC domain-containing protein [Sinomonas halotolerans]|uniref:PspC domain-containing protein n=1 Tax=Sinomonas halotolerans TaxID=1644133 RepID=A0ABU9WYB4_9MICC
MSTESTPGGAERPAPDQSGPTAPGPTGASRPGPPPPPEPGKPGPPPSDFFSRIRATGLVRGSDRWAGGVASGLAHRWGVDPVLVRGLFVVAALFLGIGVLAYGLAWLFLPEPDGRIHVQEAGRGRWTAGMTGALIVTFLGLGGGRVGFWFGEDGFGATFWGLFWLGVIGLAVYSIVRGSRRRGQLPPEPARADSASTKPTGTASSHAGPDAGAYGAGYAGSQPDAGGPYASGPYAARPYAGPVHTTQPYPEGPYSAGPPSVGGTPAGQPRRAGVPGSFTAVVVGAAVLTMGAFIVLGITGAGVLGTAAWAAGAVVLGAGIVAAGFRGRTAGILTFVSIIALVGAVTSQGMSRFADRWDGPGRSGERVALSPASVGEASAGYRLTGSSGSLDLTRLDDGGPLADDATVTVDTTFSSLAIRIPDGVPVEVRTDATLADVRFGNRSVNGISQRDTQTYNADRPGGTLVVELDATMSSITIDEED